MVAHHAVVWMPHGLARRVDSRVVSWRAVVWHDIAGCTAACNTMEFGAVLWQVLVYREVAWLDHCAVHWLDVV